MGVVQRQTIKNNAVAFIAVGVGAASRLFIYPSNPELNGYSDTVINAALVLVPFLLLGTTAVMVRYLSYLEGPDRRANAGQLLTRSLVISTGALSLLVLFNYLAEPWLNQLFVRDALHHGRWVILGLAAVMMYAGIFTSHLLSFKRIAVPVIFNNLWVKVGTALLFFLTVQTTISAGQYGNWLIGVYGVAAVGVLSYALYRKVIRLSWGKLALPEHHRRQLYGLAVFSIFASLGSQIALYIDTLSINAILGDYDTSIYSLAKFTIGVVAVPYIAVNGITSPIVAEAWKNDDREQLAYLYRESSIILFAFGGLIITGAIVCLPPLYTIIPNLEQYRAGYIAVIILSGGQLVDMATSINSNLISMTDYYRWNVAFIMILGVFNAVLNYVFIALLGFGITGAAISTAISVVLYNIVKVLFIYWKMDMQPLSSQHLKVSLFLLLLGGLALLIPTAWNPVAALLLRGVLVAVPFLALLYFTNLIPAVRQLMRQGFGYLRG